jgi:hypothetical protein
MSQRCLLKQFNILGKQQHLAHVKSHTVVEALSDVGFAGLQAHGMQLHAPSLLAICTCFDTVLHVALQAENSPPNDLEKRIKEEWEARCGVQGFAELVIQYHQQSGNAPAADPHNTDPGRTCRGPNGWQRAEVHWQQLCIVSCCLFPQSTLHACADGTVLCRTFADSLHAAAGSWLEAHWRFQLYQQGLGAYLDAEALRGFHDSARPKPFEEQFKLSQKLQQDEQQARMTGRPM